MSNLLELDGKNLDLASTQFRVELAVEEFRVHVGVCHPSFGDLTPPARKPITYLVLDWLVGEDDVERGLGHIEPLNRPSPAPRDR